MFRRSRRLAGRAAPRTFLQIRRHKLDLGKRRARVSTAIDSRDLVGEVEEAIHVLRCLEPLVTMLGSLHELENRTLAGKLVFEQLVLFVGVG